MNLRVTCFHLMVRLDYGASRKPPKNMIEFSSYLVLKTVIRSVFDLSFCN